MISLKKAVFVLCLGLGLSASMSVIAAPGAQQCQDWVDACLEGEQASCDNYQRMWFYCHQVGVLMP